MRIPKGKILIKEILPERNGIILTDRPDQRKGEVIVGSNEVEIGRVCHFKANTDKVTIDNNNYELLRENSIMYIE